MENNQITVTTNGNKAKVNVRPDLAKQYSDLSKDWAVKTDGLVNNTDYSSKYYAQESKNQANIAIENAQVTTNKTLEVIESGNTALSNIDTAKAVALTDITNLKNTSVSNITTAKNSAITSITTQETTSKNNIITKGNEQVERVNLTGVDNKTPIFSKSEIGTNEGVYKNVHGMKHSTFDKSNFTVVGSPTITNDGIASGLSANNYLTVPNKILQKIGQKPFEIRVKFSNIPMFAGTIYFPSVLGNMASAVENRTNITLSRNNQNPFLFLEANFTDGTHSSIGYTTNIPETLADVEYSLIFDGSTYTVKALANGVQLPFVRGSVSGKFIDWGTEDLFIGVRSVGASFDLKQFSITVDGDFSRMLNDWELILLLWVA